MERLPDSLTRSRKEGGGEIPDHCHCSEAKMNQCLSLCHVGSVANTTAKPRSWATFYPGLTTKNCEKQVRRSLAKDQLHVSLWALIWRRGLRGNCAAVWRHFCWQHWIIVAKHRAIRLLRKREKIDTFNDNCLSSSYCKNKYSRNKVKWIGMIFLKQARPPRVIHRLEAYLVKIAAHLAIAAVCQLV